MRDIYSQVWIMLSKQLIFACRNYSDYVLWLFMAFARTFMALMNYGLYLISTVVIIIIRDSINVVASVIYRMVS